MEAKNHPSAFHAVAHKAACGLALAMSFYIGAAAAYVVATRIAAAKNLQAWCTEVGCVNQPGTFTSDPLIVYSDKAREATQVVERYYRPTPFPSLELTPPPVQYLDRPAKTSAIGKKGSKK